MIFPRGRGRRGAPDPRQARDRTDGAEQELHLAAVGVRSVGRMCGRPGRIDSAAGLRRSAIVCMESAVALLFDGCG
jgi:hypothetical protein